MVSSVTHVPPPRSMQRMVSVATYVSIPVAFGAILWLHAEHYFSSTPLWVVIPLLVVTAPMNLAAAAWLARDPQSVLRNHVRAMSTAFTTAAIIYSVGWGALLVAAYAVGATELLRTGGSSTAKPHTIWALLAIALGELAVEVGWAPSVVRPELSHAIAISGVVCLAIVTRVLGESAEATERADTLLRNRGAHFEALIEHASDVIGVISLTGKIHSMSPAVFAVLGYTPDEVQGRSISEYVAPEYVTLLQQVVAGAQVDGHPVTELELPVRHRDGDTRLLAATVSVSGADWDGQIIVNLHDITTQRALEERLRHDASHDSLTSLLNRKAFSDVCETACARAERHGWSVAMLYIDLDGFKSINDSLGHDMGDRVLVETSRRLEGCVRREELLARLGGDEFAVLLEAVADERQAINLAERILDVVARPIAGLPDGVTLGASIGIAIRSSEGIEMSTLMRQADEAMYCAKRNGRARWEISPDLRDSISSR